MANDTLHITAPSPDALGWTKKGGQQQLSFGSTKEWDTQYFFNPFMGIGIFIFCSIGIGILFCSSLFAPPF